MCHFRPDGCMPSAMRMIRWHSPFLSFAAALTMQALPKSLPVGLFLSTSIRCNAAIKWGKAAPQPRPAARWVCLWHKRHTLGKRGNLMRDAGGGPGVHLTIVRLRVFVLRVLLMCVAGVA
eukprot:3293803-Amphidinium_carterae.1